MKNTDFQSSDWLSQEKEYEKDNLSLFLQQMADESSGDSLPQENANIGISEEVKKLNELLEELRKAMKKNSLSEWMTSEDVKKALGISERTMHTWRNTGKLRFAPIEQKFYYEKTDVENLLLKGYHKKKVM